MQEKRQYPSKPDKVYFFGTCVIDLIYPDAGMAAIQLLEREGLEVIFPRTSPVAGNRPSIPVSRMKPGKWPENRCVYFTGIIPSSFLPAPVPG